MKPAAALLALMLATIGAGTRAATSAAEPATSADSTAPCTDCGTITAINAGGRDSRPAWMGTLGDGGSGVSGLPGRPRAPGVGDASGSIVGRDAEGQTLRRGGYEIVVLMDDGTRRIVRVDTRPAMVVGNRVRVVGRQLQLR